MPAPDHPKICDAVFATCVIDARGQAATLFWARSQFFGTPLLLLDWDVSQVAPRLWTDARDRLAGYVLTCRARLRSMGVYVEDESLAAQGGAVGVHCETIYQHLTATDRWTSLCLMMLLASRGGKVGVCAQALETAKRHPKREEVYDPALNFGGGPRPEAPTVAAFVYGVVLALDPTASVPPRPARVKIAA